MALVLHNVNIHNSDIQMISYGQATLVFGGTRTSEADIKAIIHCLISLRAISDHIWWKLNASPNDTAA